jgi:lipopolysaccharide transport protein LptA
MASFLGRLSVCALALGSGALAAQDRRPASELLLDMQSFEIDNKTNLINLRGPRITQGDLSIAADEALATGIDFQAKSEWKFNGNVRITLDAAVVTSDSAVFSFDDKQLARGELAGNATFEDAQPDGAEPARGGASKIVYDYTGRTLRLTENAWFQGDGVQAEGCDLVYNLTTERVTSGSSDCADLFRIRFLPKQGENAAGADPPR